MTLLKNYIIQNIMKSKCGEFMSFLKNILFWFLILIYFEFGFSLFAYNSISNSIFNILLFSLLLSSFFSLICGSFKNNVLRYIILFILGFYFSAIYIYHDVFVSYFSFSMIGLSEQLTSFIDETLNAITSNIHIMFFFFIPFIVNIIFRKKFVFLKFKLIDYIINFVFLLICIVGVIVNICVNKNKPNSVYDLIFNINEISLNVEKLGVLPSGILDVGKLIFGFESKINIDIPNDEVVDEEFGYNVLDLKFNDANKNIKLINDYVESLSGTKKNEYTGIFKGYNLIFITAESFSQIGISEKLTPTLYKLTNSGFVFSNFYTPNNASTLGGEFQSLTGLFSSGDALPKWKKGTNTFPFGIATVFKDIGYNTFAYHNHTYSFQNRNKYLKSLGFDNYKGCGTGMEKLINCKSWPESDYQMMDTTYNDYISSTPFFAYYMTVSGHFEYNFSENAMSLKHRDKVKDLDLSTEAKAYLATQIELDLALERLLNALEENGVLDKTVIVMQADHYPYRLSLNDINSLSTYKRDSVVEVNHNSLIIWNSKLETKIIDKVCMSIDVIPTIYNLFGIEFDSRLFVGQDIFSDSPGLAIFTNRSWVTDYGTYYANSSKFVPNDEVVSEDYIKKINNVVNNRMNISKMIITNNYYNYISID